MGNIHVYRTDTHRGNELNELHGNIHLYRTDTHRGNELNGNIHLYRTDTAISQLHGPNYKIYCGGGGGNVFLGQNCCINISFTHPFLPLLD